MTVTFIERLTVLSGSRGGRTVDGEQELLGLGFFRYTLHGKKEKFKVHRTSHVILSTNHVDVVNL